MGSTRSEKEANLGIVHGERGGNGPAVSSRAGLRRGQLRLHEVLTLPGASGLRTERDRLSAAAINAHTSMAPLFLIMYDLPPLRIYVIHLARASPSPQNNKSILAQHHLKPAGS